MTGHPPHGRGGRPPARPLAPGDRVYLTGLVAILPANTRQVALATDVPIGSTLARLRRLAARGCLRVEVERDKYGRVLERVWSLPDPPAPSDPRGSPGQTPGAIP